MALDKLTIINNGGLSTTSDYRVGVLTATKFVGPIEGSITATDASFSGNVSIAGTLTYEDVTNIDSIGLGTFRNGIQVLTGTATTALVVDGDARVTGILTVGSSSLTLDGTNNLVNVGTALTLGHTQGLQFHTQNLHAAGFEINNVNASGIITASQFVGDGSNLSNTGSTLSEPSTGTQRIVTTSLTSGTMTSSGTGSELAYDYANNELEFSDNTKISLGTDRDLQLSHNTSDSIISHIGSATGNLKILSGGAQSIECVKAGAVKIAHNGTTKLATTNTGITVTGQGVFSSAITASTYIQGTSSNGGLKFYSDSSASKGVVLNTDDHLVPTHDSNSDLGLTGTRWRNVYADTLYGDGSNLTGITGTTINNNANYRLISGDSNANELNAEPRLTFDGNNLRIDHGDGVDGILGEAYTNYFGLKHADQTLDSEYMIISDDSHTFISASSGSNVYIRNGNNDSTNQLIVGSGNDALTWRGNKIFHAGNDGSGSGLDSDTLDGVQGSSFLRSDTNDSFTSGRLTITSSTDYALTFNNTSNAKIDLQGSNDPYIRFREGTTEKAYIQWHSSGKLILANQETNERLDIGSGASGLQFLVDGVARTVWHAANDGSGSGLDADTLDGVEGASFLRSDANDVCSSRIQFTKNEAADYDTIATSTGSQGAFEIKNTGSGNDAFIAFHTGGDFAFYFGLDADTNDLSVGGWSMGNNKYKVWHAGNDGSGSGLDSDTLDGIQASSFLRSDANDTMSGVLTLTSGSSYPLTINNSSNAKIVLAGSTQPYIRFREGSTDKAYLQWTEAGFLQFVNQESGEYVRIGNGTNGLQFVEGGDVRTVIHTGNASSNLTQFVRSDTNDTMSGSLTVRDVTIQDGYHLRRSSHHTGHLEGGYNNIGYNDANTNPIFTIGSSYNPASTTLSNMYGIGYCNSNSASFISFNGSSNWGMYVAADGDARVWLDGANGAVSAKGHIYGNRFYCDLQTTRYLSDVTGNYGSIQINGGGSGNWQGYSIDGRFVFMHNGADHGGLYNDVDNDWFVYCQRQGPVWLRHNDSDRLETTSYGVKVSSTLLMNGGNLRRGNHHTGHLEGSYNNIGSNSDKSNPIYTIGSSYNPTDAGLSNMYGIGYSHGNASFTPTGAGWGLYVAADGDSRVYLDGGNGRVYINSSSRYLSNVSGQYGSIQINGGGASGWEGFSIDGRIVFMHDGSSGHGIYNDVDNEWTLYAERNSHTYIYYNGSWKGRASSDGWEVNGHCYPNSNDGHDLGKSGNRWRNIYTTDLQLSNESKKDKGGNDVDGTWGDYTIQEGEDDLFLINNRSGKKYKFMLQEVK